MDLNQMYVTLCDFFISYDDIAVYKEEKAIMVRTDSSAFFSGTSLSFVVRLCNAFNYSFFISKSDYGSLFIRIY